MSGARQDDLETRLRRQIEAYHESALVYAAVKLGLPDRMGERAWTAEQLAAELALSAPHLLRFMRGLVTLGICQELPHGTFALAEGGWSLRSDSPSRLDKKVQIVVEQYWRPWANLASCLQTGTPAFDRVFGLSVRDWRQRNAAQGALFESYLAKETLADSASFIDAVNFAGVRTVADIGGGFGGLLAALLQAHPHLQGVLFDRPETVAGAEPHLESLGIADRTALVGGDILTAIPVRADLYVLNGVLQQWYDTDALAILKNVRAAMPEGARLIIIERVLPERATDDPAAVMLDLHMMTITGGRVRTLAECEALLSDAGLKLSEVTPTSSGFSVLASVRRA